MLARLVRSADFERVLQTRSRLRSVHFAIHHVADHPSRRHRKVALAHDLSTTRLSGVVSPVDDSAPPEPGAVWLGAVVPKRHARRAVTRSLLKRQIRAAMGRGASGLAGGLWVVRLRAPFDRAHYISAASEALRCAARAELEALIASAARVAAVSGVEAARVAP